MNISAIGHNLCNFSDFASMLNALIFAIKTVVVQYKNKWVIHTKM